MHYAQWQKYYYEIKMARTKIYIKKEKDISIMLNVLMSYLIIRYVSFFPLPFLKWKLKLILIFNLYFRHGRTDKVQRLNNSKCDTALSEYCWIVLLDSMYNTSLFISYLIAFGGFGLFFSLLTGFRAHAGHSSVSTRAYFSSLKRLGCEADHAPQSSAQCKNSYSLTSCSQ